MTLLEKILIGIIAGSVLSLVVASLIGRFVHHVDEDADHDLENYRKGSR
jgi:hypothetical protein